MDPARWKRIEELFASALALPAEQRSEYLRHECGEDFTLLHDVQHLIDADQHSTSLFSGIDAELPALSDAELEPSERIGPYRRPWCMAPCSEPLNLGSQPLFTKVAIAVPRCYPKRSQLKYTKKPYRVRNWQQYETALRNRGDLTLWFSEEAIAAWRAPTGEKPGGQPIYSDLAIESALTARLVYGLALRQTEGFLQSISTLLDLGLHIPDHTTLSRCSSVPRFRE